MLAAALLLAGAAAAATPLESLTWTELRDRIAAGANTVIVPIGGTEQNGPHIALGKHNERVRVLAARIAGRLGDTIVAPVLAYVPEGSIDPPAAHMRWPGTISISDAAFEGVIEGAAASLRRAGFRDIVLIGDHGGYQAQMQRTAARLNARWRDGTRVHALVDYYRAASATGHADRADTSMAMAVDPALVRQGAIGAPVAGDGTQGDPRGASAAQGEEALERIVAASVAAIRQRRQR